MVYKVGRTTNRERNTDEEVAGNGPKVGMPRERQNGCEKIYYEKKGDKYLL